MVNQKEPIDDVKQQIRLYQNKELQSADCSRCISLSLIKSNVIVFNRRLFIELKSRLLMLVDIKPLKLN